MIKVSSLAGRIGAFWWINAHPGNPLAASNWLPGLERDLVFWGGCGFGHDIAVKTELMPSDEVG